MPYIPQRWDGFSQWYFVTVVTQHREPIFSEKECCCSLQKAIREVYLYHRFRLAGLTIIPDHWHGLLRPYPPGVIETIIGAIKQNMLHRIWKNQKRPSIWQDRFLDHRIRDKKDFAYHLEYIRVNAVKHELVEEPGAYPWCFIHEFPFGKGNKEFVAM